MKAVGTKVQVWNGTAKHTAGGLTKDQLMKNKRGNIVSKKKHAHGKKMFLQNKLKPGNAARMSELRRRRKR